jgi:hypothetical protein
MRAINDKEKRIINYIIETPKSDYYYNLIPFLLSEISFKNIEIKYDSESKKFWVKKSNTKVDSNHITAKVENILPIAEIVSFLSYLEEMNFIVFLECGFETENIDLSNDNNYMEITDTEVYNFLLKNIGNGIFVTQHLIEYKNRMYKTVEEKRHEEQMEGIKKQIRLAVIAAFIAAISAVIAIFYR